MDIMVSTVYGLSGANRPGWGCECGCWLSDCGALKQKRQFMSIYTGSTGPRYLNIAKHAEFASSGINDFVSTWMALGAAGASESQRLLLIETLISHVFVVFALPELNRGLAAGKGRTALSQQADSAEAPAR
eukprot:scaffold128312_cov47-Prasinocladus_malaysianus.AAC.1